MAKKIEVSQTRIEQFNKMVEMLRTIRTYDVKKELAMYKRLGISREVAFQRVTEKLQAIARESRGIAELREVSNG